MDSQHVTVRFSGEYQLVEVAWKEHCETSVFRDTMTEVMQFVKARGLTRWLCDRRLLQYLLYSDQNWLVKVLLPGLPASEEKFRFADLLSLTNLELMSSVSVREMAMSDPVRQDRWEMEVFMSREQALLWLD